METKCISQAVISRLPRYFRSLGELRDEGVERISSQELSERMKVTASQIRQDFNNFGGFGQQGYGYNVNYLYSEIGKILGLDKCHNFIIIGAGNLGYGISKEYRKKGYGNILFRELLTKCKNFGYSEIKLFPHKENIATVKIMLKNGGKIVGDFKGVKHIIRIPII